MSLTLSGPDVDVRFPAQYGLGAALSRAVTEAERARLDEASYYVRDQNGDVVGRVDRTKGTTLVRRIVAARKPRPGYVSVRQYGQEYEVALIPEVVPDRGAEEGDGPLRSAVPSSTRRPGIPPDGETKEEPEVTEQTTSPKRSSARSSAKKRSAAPARTKKAAATAAVEPVEAVVAEPEGQQSGDALYQTLLGKIRETVDGVQVKENKSKTSSRLLTKSGRAFAYIFPPRKGGVALKIPKQLLDVEPELPEGHGFKLTGWGLTRTVKTEPETQIVAEALGVAAKAVAAK